MTDTNYTDDLELHANTSAQAESLLHILGQAAEGIGFCVNANKTCTCVLNKKEPSLLKVSL